MDISNKFASLAPLLEKYQTTDDTTFSLVFIAETLSHHDIIAIKKSAKWCDVTICVDLTNNINENQHKILQQAGCNILFNSQELAPKLNLDSGNINSGFILKTILEVMPSAIVVQIVNTSLLKVLLRLNHNYPNLFSIIYSETPQNVMNKQEKNIQTTLKAIAELIISGEKNVEALRNIKNPTINQLNIQFVNSYGETLEKTLQNGSYFICSNLEDNSVKIKNAIKINV